MKIRKFKFSENGPLMSKDGEFLHINDVTLLLKEERETWMNCVRHNDGIENPSEITQELTRTYKDRVELLDELISKIRKGE